MSVIAHLVQGEEVSQDGFETIIRATHLLTIGGSINTIAPVLDEAGIPVLGDAHPQHGSAILVNRTADAVTPSQIAVNLVWRTKSQEETSGGQFSISTGIYRFQSPVDLAGDNIQTFYDYPASADDASVPWTLEGVLREPQYHMAELNLRAIIFRWTRVSDSFLTASGRIIRAGGAVNNSEWNGVPAGGALCSHAELEPVQGGAKWREIYEFTLRTVGWTESFIHTNSQTGKPVKLQDPPGEEVFNAQVYRDENFNSLDLDFPG